MAVGLYAHLIFFVWQGLKASGNRQFPFENDFLLIAIQLLRRLFSIPRLSARKLIIKWTKTLMKNRFSLFQNQIGFAYNVRPSLHKSLIKCELLVISSLFSFLSPFMCCWTRREGFGRIYESWKTLCVNQNKHHIITNAQLLFHPCLDYVQ